MRQEETVTFPIQCFFQLTYAFTKCCIQLLLTSTVVFCQKYNLVQNYFSSKQAERKAVSRSGAHLEGDVLSLAELWIRPSDKGLAKLLLSGLSVSDSPVLSDGCCRHRSMHHTLVKAPLLHSPPFR